MTELDWNRTPEDVLAHWPDALPLAALVTGAGHGGHARLSMLAVPEETVECRPSRARSWTSSERKARYGNQDTRRPLLRLKVEGVQNDALFLNHAW